MEGRFAKVSIYEFVNDWIRPEISWKIMSYAVEDPHQEGVIVAQNYRLEFVPKGHDIGDVPLDREPYRNKAGNYKFMGGVPYNRVAVYNRRRFCHMDGSGVTLKEYNEFWALNVDTGKYGGWVGGGGRAAAVLDYKNNIVAKLFRANKIDIKAEFAEMLKENQVSGRTKLLKALIKKPNTNQDEYKQAKQNIIRALMKV